jgi:hypothetical protein
VSVHGRTESTVVHQLDRLASDMRSDRLPDHAAIDTAFDGSAVGADGHDELPDAPSSESIHTAIPVGADLPVATAPQIKPRLARRGENGAPYSAGVAPVFRVALGNAMSKFVSEEARASLSRQQIALELAPQFAADWQQHVLLKAFAEFSIRGDSIDTIRQFTSCVYGGVMPPPNILIALAEAFSTYLDGAGASTLDAAFALQARQKIGNPLKNRMHKEERATVLFKMWQLRHASEAAGKKISILDAAGLLINELNLEESEDTLSKAYSEANFDEVIGKSQQIVEETFLRKK